MARRKSHYHSGIHTSPKLKGEAHYRSGWEEKIMRLLDMDDDVISYQYEPFFIPYISNVGSGNIRKYLPDIIVERRDRKQMLEIKPKSKVDQRLNVKKFAAARAWCEENGYEFIVVTEDFLKEAGLL
jgi:hypothetical protein